MQPTRSAAALGFTLLLAWAGAAFAQVTVGGAWVRGTVAGQKVTAAFMQLTSRADAALVDVATPAAKFVEIHEMKKDGAVMKMSAIDRLPLPAGKPVNLTPDGYHIMLFDLKQPLKEGDVVPLTLTLEDSAGRKSTVEVRAAVKALNASGAPAHKH